jgi:nucleotide-binding universal stress UspA family protein
MQRLDVVEKYLSNFHVCKPDATFKPLRTICMPVDESEFSSHSVTWAMNNILQPTDLILLLNVRKENVYQPEQLFGTNEAFQEVDDRNRAASEALLESFAKKLQSHHFQGVEAVGLVGDPRKALIDQINDRKPTIVIVGQRGMGALSRLVIGSVSDYLIHHSHSPVLVVTK